MKKLFSALALLVLATIVLCGVFFAYVYWQTGTQMAEKIPFTPADVAALTDPAAIAKGKHLYITRGCADCHAEHGGGQYVIPGGPMGKLGGTNLTRGDGSVIVNYTATADWVRAIRHGLAPDGRKLIFMPSHEFNHFSDQDIAELVSYIKSMAPVDNTIELDVGPLARLLGFLGDFVLLPADRIEHSATPRAAPTAGPTIEYGRYLAMGCTGCHGAGFSGGSIPGVPPDWPQASNLTPHATGLGQWTDIDFIRAMRDGVRPDGSEISPIMPWRGLGQMHEWELQALWAYFSSLPPTPKGNR